MSDSLYWTVLRWHNGHGIAKMHGNTITLSAGPDLGSGPVHMLRYVPEIDAAEVTMHNSELPRRMTRAEIKAADELLAALTREVPRDSCRYDEPWKDGRC